MLRGRFPWLSVCLVTVAGFALATQVEVGAAEKVRKPVVMKHLKFDAALPQTGLFEAMEEEKVSVRLVAKSEFDGHLLIENKTDAPFTIQLPEAFVGIQVLAQFQPPGGAGLGVGQNQQQGQGGQNQAVGGGAGGPNGNNNGANGNNGAGLGLFSIPVATVAKVPVHMVCLEHGKKTPSQLLHYTIARPEKYTSDLRVHQLCKSVGTGRLDRASAQAAAWHIANNMSWEQLSHKTYHHIGSPETPYFTRDQLKAAHAIVDDVEGRVAKLKASGDLTGLQTAPPLSPTSLQP